ncbi:lasso peptide biosynthesis PqqD family chaperone [Allokutzneria albata]|uniref:Coenzyme PQQ synthesis protein D (PqqD) n=1 Tax=Allokutzneria albata TaxID=211114 RepID=A0A1G9QZJ6_ALLAB|nr:lasso peptide biosynthesis PqqD family chaperone [Allokutzneria albata]SDM15655.1 Coenzyme PQQ synthesis protein D (PqqD) [Allokutzneria albata]
MTVLHEHVSVVSTDYGAVLLDRSSGRYWALNPTGALVLSAVRDSGDEKAAVDAVLRAFDVDPSTALRDVQALLEQCRAAGLLAE